MITIYDLQYITTANHNYAIKMLWIIVTVSIIYASMCMCYEIRNVVSFSDGVGVMATANSYNCIIFTMVIFVFECLTIRVGPKQDCLKVNAIFQALCQFFQIQTGLSLTLCLPHLLPHFSRAFVPSNNSLSGGTSLLHLFPSILHPHEVPLYWNRLGLTLGSPCFVVTLLILVRPSCLCLHVAVCRVADKGGC